MELRDGTQTYDAVVQRDLGLTCKEPSIRPERAHRTTKTHMTLASEYRGKRNNEVFPHWMLLPPSDPSQIMPVPPGSVRGVWRERAFTQEDDGKIVSIDGNKVMLDGEVRKVEWGDHVPENVSNLTLSGVGSHDEDGRPCVYLSHDLSEIFNPFVAGGATAVADIAFASVERRPSAPGEDVETTFYLPTTEDRAYNHPQHLLSNARTTVLGNKQFSHFVFTRVHEKL